MKKNNRKNNRKKAVAVSYDSSKASAPKIVAKGEGKLAQRIVEEAMEHDVPLYEDPSLAEALSYLGLGDEVPENLYELVAKVLAFVYQLDEKWREKYL